MRLRRPTAALLGLTLVLAGCYGSTEPASDIAFDHATLNGRGTTNNGPADVYFEIWPAANPNQRGTTLPRDYPGGVTGPVSQPNSPFGPYGLVPDTEYGFRLCGRDEGAADAVCAQTRNFRTKKPSGDLLRGFFALQLTGVGHTGNVQAESDRTGGSATGRLQLPGDFGNTFSGDVTCLSVHGHDAAVGALGTTVDGNAASGLLVVRDDPQPPSVSTSADQVRYTVTPNGGAPDCASASFDGLHGAQITLFTTYDTP
jgi:hypothetical protein